MTSSARSWRALNWLALVLLAMAGWASYQRYEAGRADLERATRELQQSSSLAQQIEILRQRPDRASLQSQSHQALAEAIERSADSSGVPRERIARVEPQQPRRAGDSDYLEHGTTVQFDGVTLAQLAKTLQSLRSTAGLDQLRVSTLRITTPYRTAAEESPETWNVELILTYYVYSPKPPGRQKS